MKILIYLLPRIILNIITEKHWTAEKTRILCGFWDLRSVGVAAVHPLVVPGIFLPSTQDVTHTHTQPEALSVC